MKRILFPTLAAFAILLASFAPKNHKNTAPSPLSSYSTEWNDAKYLKCNTAKEANYMSAKEKELIYILNLVRVNPPLFANTVLKKYSDAKFSQQEKTSWYYKTLVEALVKLKPLVLLYPDSLCYNGAQCHALSSGAAGIVGHDRTNADCKKKWYYNGECCDYGHNDPLDIVMSLLVDEGISSLGHRKICLGAYNKIGVSIQFHKTYRHTAVLDFHY
jgi:uncharacterized protein YkwD